jgi:hypothetical protein
MIFRNIITNNNHQLFNNYYKIKTIVKKFNNRMSLYSKMPNFNENKEFLPKIYENLNINKLPEAISVCGFPGL